MRISFSRKKHSNTSIAILLSVLSILFTSCEKEVHIDLKGGPAKLVVEGSIETGGTPMVILTKSIGFSTEIDLNTLANSFVHDAIVTVSDGNKTVTLKEYKIDTGGITTFSFYTVDTSDIANTIKGEENKSYKLTIQYDGQTYTATTKIPVPKPVDTMWTQPYDLPGNDIPENALQLYVNYTDPDTLGNFMRYFTRKNNMPFYAAREVFSDELINGTPVKELTLPLGRDQSVEFEGDTARFLFPGDVITLKWCAIDKGVFDFWNSFAYAAQSTGNPFATPINVHSNMSNGALGVWAGYGVTTRTIVAQ